MTKPLVPSIERVSGEITSTETARSAVTVREANGTMHATVGSRVKAPSGSHVLVRVCLICNRPMAPYQRTVYLDSGAVAHVPCRRAFRGAATTSMAVIRPSSQALRLRARERRGVEALYTDIQRLGQRGRRGGRGPDASAGPSSREPF